MSPEDLAHAFVRAWNDHDAGALADLFLPDGRMVTAFGQVLRGRTGIRNAHARAFRGPYAGAKITTRGVETLRERPQLALVTLEWQIGGTDAAPGERGSLLLALERRGESWLIMAAQNTARTIAAG